ncbi:hypothetical protein RFI_21744 [Reticulomyxa filosa]|uniref:JmjC domain-containing protein n=1 Tax=Reticulomyxa filosa TaxID=46433 RepID=X6MPL1_RETFI|nr:hypothetical protein RFI_21744 [Reticulomyxa filosa]|eukprot:ETO15616.1 hypothetical protein RFI_21744 [Reticulomyxa filosa]
MRKEYECLLEDIDTSMEWASDAFGTEIDAVNFWMGSHRSVTTIHSDNYENLYCVISGQKTFELYPPTNVDIFKHKRKYQMAKYHLDSVSKEWSVEPQRPAQFVEWIDDFKTDQIPGMQVIVNPGDLLYLPSLWYHKVTQTEDNFGKCIAVNMWYDMQFDIKFNTIHFVQNVVNILKQPDEQECKEI